ISAALRADGGRAVVARMDGDVVWKGQQDAPNRVDQRRVVAARQIRSPDRARKEGVAGENRRVPSGLAKLEDDAARGGSWRLVPAGRQSADLERHPVNKAQ